MFFIILAVAFFIFLIWCGIKGKENLIFVIPMSLFLSFMIIYMGIVLTESYENEPEHIAQEELIALNNDEQNPIYIVKKSNKQYEYRIEEDGIGVNIKLIENDNNYIEIIESEKCKIPVLNKYERKSKWGIFSVGFIKKWEYVFYIPIGTEQGLYDLE